MCEAKIDRTKRRMREIQNYGQRPQQYSQVIIRISRKGIKDLNNIMNQLDLSDIYKMLCYPTIEYTFL